MIAFLKRRLIGKVVLYHNEDNFQLRGVPFARLTQMLGELPGVVFTRKKTFVWSLEKYEADFTFGGHDFGIDTDPWDGGFWVSSKTGGRATEMLTLREQVERCLIASGVSFEREP